MVIHVITRLALGGAQQVVMNVARQMRREGKEVCVFTGVSEDNNIILKAVQREGITVKICPYLQKTIAPLTDLKALLWIVRNLKAMNPETVHIHSSKAGILGRIACRIAGNTRVVYHVHGWSFSSVDGWKKRLYLSMERIFYYLTTTFVFVCQQDMFDFVKLGGNSGITRKAEVIYPGSLFIPKDTVTSSRAKLREKLGYNENDFVIGSVGRLEYQKYPQFFVKAAKNYSENDVSARYLWIGDGQDSAEIESLIEKYGLSGRFQTPGYIEEVEDYFSVFDIFVITSRYEGLPLTSVKALSCAVPVVCFQVNGLIDLDNRFSSVFGVEFDNQEKFLKQLSNARLFAMNHKSTLSLESEQVRNEFSLTNMCQSIIRIYEPD